MIDKLPGIINYLIAAALLTVLLFVLKRKNAEQPHIKISGFPVQTIITIIYFAIGIDVLLIIAILMGWIVER